MLAQQDVVIGNNTTILELFMLWKATPQQLINN
jgi:hypothetical protein